MLAFGPNRSQISRRQLRTSLWPEKFILSNGVEVLQKDLDLSGNNDLMVTSSGFVADSKNPSPDRREHVVGFFERFEKTGTLINPDRCADFNTTELNGAGWYVLTSGREYSATENFLSFIWHVKNKFKIVGARSNGGTGAPFDLTLPHTKMVLTLSQARHFDKVTGEWPIEALGIPVDVMSESDASSDFEDRVVRFLTKDTSDKSKRKLPALVEKALALPNL